MSRQPAWCGLIDLRTLRYMDGESQVKVYTDLTSVYRSAVVTIACPVTRSLELSNVCTFVGVDLNL